MRSVKPARVLSTIAIDSSACRTCPAVPLALALMTGITAALLPLSEYTRWVVAVPAAIIVLYLLKRTLGLRWWHVLIPAFLGFGLGAVSWLYPGNTYIRHLQRLPAAAHVRATIVEPAYIGGEIPWLAGRRRYSVDINAIRPIGESGWQPCSGRALLVTDGKQALAYGMQLRVQTTVVELEPPLVDGSFSYRSYLRGQGIEHELQAVSAGRIEQGPSGWRRFPATLYWCRNRLVEHLVANITTETNARMLAALALGYREALTRDISLQFLRGGAIHLFAVSGLHIGIVASLLMLGMRLCGVSCRARFWSLPVLLGTYVFITGGAASAVRAWLMVSIWAVSCARFRAASPLNAVAVAAILILVWNPMQILMTGFQFSFIIVTVLLLGWRLAEDVRLALTEKVHWSPQRLRPTGLGHLEWWHSKGLSLLAVVALAWFGSTGLVAAKNAMTVPAGILVNLMLSLVAWLGLLTAMIKTMFALLPLGWLDVTLGWWLDQLMTTVRAVVGAGDLLGGAHPVPRPAAGLAVLYYAFLFTGLVPRFRPRIRAGAWGAACLLLVFMLSVPSGSGSEPVIMQGTGTHIPTVLIPGRHDAGPILVNVGSYDRARDVKAWLQQNGVRRIQLLVLHDTVWHAAGGLRSLLEEYEVEVLVCNPSSRSKRISQLPPQLRNRIGRIRYARNEADGHAGGVEKVETGNVLVTFHEGQGNDRTVVTPRGMDYPGIEVMTTSVGTGSVTLRHNSAQASWKRHVWTSLMPRLDVLKLEKDNLKLR